MRRRATGSALHVGLLLAVLACAGCAADERPAVRAIDLRYEFPRAEKRPAENAFSIAEHTLLGTRHAGIEAPPASRLIWTGKLPARSTLRAMVAVLPAAGEEAIVSFRVGVSDERLYEALAAERVSAARTRDVGWIPLSADLSAYAGRKWSVFYRPGAKAWRLVLSTDRIDGNGRAFWGSPGVDADVDAARDWRSRQ